MHIEPIRSSVINGKQQPENTTLVGYAALIKTLGAECPYPQVPSAVSDSKIRSDKGRNHLLRDGFAVYERNYAVRPDFSSHLTFALKHERLDLLLLKRIFMKTPERVMEDFIREAPTGSLRRQAWFLYEWLTQKRLDLPSADAGAYVDAIDPNKWHTGTPENSPRHRVRNNLPGTPLFCPMIERLPELDGSIREIAADKVNNHLRSDNIDFSNRLGRSLLLKDSKSTFAIEHEKPNDHEAARWSNWVAKAGEEPLSVDLLIKIQKDLMRDRRFIVPGIRRAGVFLGDHDNGNPVPVWIGARPEDLDDLMKGIVEADARMEKSGLDPLAHAAAVSFGIVYVHPFEDGNGRLHRYSMQHVFARQGLRPGGITIPIAKAIWEDIDGYRSVLSAYDRERMPYISWKATGNGNVEVLNDTSDLYRFFDATEHALFMRKCVDKILDFTIPHEIDELHRWDKFIEEARTIIDVPGKLNFKAIRTFVAIVRENGGELSKKKRKTFSALTEEEISGLEEIVRDVYEIETPGFEI